MIIVGAGLAGLLTANAFPQARIIEAQGRDKVEHKALLRFRSTAVAGLTGIEFRKVKVHKGIWHGGKFVAPSIRLANLYSRKVIGRLADRSIWNLDPVERYIAPEDFISMLLDNCASRISWETPLDLEENRNEPIISTMPMSVLSSLLYQSSNDDTPPKFEHAPIHVARYRIPNADVFQTVYFTDQDVPIYRASITGNMLIVEAMSPEFKLDDVLCAFGINRATTIGAVSQKFGKIVPIDDMWRRNFILRASMDHGIHSVGRFATWRNILLDDVVHDLTVVKRLINLGGGYYNRLNA